MDSFFLLISYTPLLIGQGASLDARTRSVHTFTLSSIVLLVTLIGHNIVYNVRSVSSMSSMERKGEF